MGKWESGSDGCYWVKEGLGMGMGWEWDLGMGIERGRAWVCGGDGLGYRGYEYGVWVV